MIRIFFLQVHSNGTISLLPVVLSILIAFLMYKRILISVKKEISEFKQSMDKPTLNGQLMFKSGECIINVFKWGVTGSIISSILLILQGPYKDIYGLAGGLIAVITVAYMLSRTIAIALYLKGGKPE